MGEKSELKIICYMNLKLNNTVECFTLNFNLEFRFFFYEPLEKVDDSVYVMLLCRSEAGHLCVLLYRSTKLIQMKCFNTCS